jgi:hypothetical protein
MSHFFIAHCRLRSATQMPACNDANCLHHSDGVRDIDDRPFSPLVTHIP